MNINNVIDFFNIESIPVKADELKIGNKVHYVKYENINNISFENGIVKEIVNDLEARIVYHCAGEWDNYKNYTSQLTPISRLRVGWR